MVMLRIGSSVLVNGRTMLRETYEETGIDLEAIHPDNIVKLDPRGKHCEFFVYSYSCVRTEWCFITGLHR